MRIRKADSNQSEIMRLCRQIPGVSVVTLHEVGKGVGDILLGYRKKNYLIEIKNPAMVKSQKKLTKAEKEFHRDWTGQIAIVESIEDILKLIQ